MSAEIKHGGTDYQGIVRVLTETLKCDTSYVVQQVEQLIRQRDEAAEFVRSRASVPAVGEDALAKAKAIVEEYKQRVMQLPSGDAVPCAKWLETRLRIAFDLAATLSEPQLTEDESQLVIGAIPLQALPETPVGGEAKIDFSCRVCGVQCSVAPDPPARAVCSEHCEDHDYRYERNERGHYCQHCGQQAPEDWYDD